MVSGLPEHFDWVLEPSALEPFLGQRFFGPRGTEASVRSKQRSIFGWRFRGGRWASITFRIRNPKIPNLPEFSNHIIS